MFMFKGVIVCCLMRMSDAVVVRGVMVVRKQVHMTWTLVDMCRETRWLRRL